MTWIANQNCWWIFVVNVDISQFLSVYTEIKTKHWTCCVTKCTFLTPKYNECDYLSKLLSQLEHFMIELPDGFNNFSTTKAARWFLFYNSFRWWLRWKYEICCSIHLLKFTENKPNILHKSCCMKIYVHQCNTLKFKKCTLLIGSIYQIFRIIPWPFKKFYRIRVVWTPLLNRTPPIEYSSTTPVKNPNLGQKLAKFGQIAAKFELNPTQKSILKSRTPGFK